MLKLLEDAGIVGRCWNCWKMLTLLEDAGIVPIIGKSLDGLGFGPGHVYARLDPYSSKEYNKLQCLRKDD